CCRRTWPTTRRRPRASRSGSIRSSRPDIGVRIRARRAGRSSVSAETLVVVGLSVLVTVLVILPLVSVAAGAIREAGGVSTRPLRAVLGATRIIGNTVLVGVGTTLLAVTVGGALALALARVNTPGRPPLGQPVTLPRYITPLMRATAVAWLDSPYRRVINLIGR